MKKIIVLALVILLAGCGEPGGYTTTDQCLRVELFQQCLAKIPPGPAETVYNDWDEVVESCETSAYYQSQRTAKFVKIECRAR